MANGQRGTVHRSPRGVRLRLLLFSDLHLDTPYEWAPPAIAEQRRLAAREALVAILGEARQREVDAIACAGDLFNRRTVKPANMHWLAAALRSAGVPVLIAPGNSDFIGPLGGYSSQEWPENVTVFETDVFSSVQLAEGVTVWGAAHTEAHRARSFFNGVHIDLEGVNFALFHGAETSGTLREPEADPCATFEESDIEAAGFDHALVGHYQEPHLGWMHTYPGAPVAHAIGGSPIGNTVLVTLKDDGSIERDIVPIASPALHGVVVDVSGAKSKRDVLRRSKAAMEGRSGLVRLTFVGKVPADLVLDREDLAGLTSSPDTLIIDWLAEVELDTTGSIDEPTIRGQFVRDVLSSSLPDERLARVELIGLRALNGSMQLEGPR